MSWLPSRHPALAGLTLSTLLALGCEPPPVVPTQDKQQHIRAARIEGHVVVQGPARGNAVVFLYDAARLPPPQGTGRPVSFTVIPQAELYGTALHEAGNAGPFTAPFTFGNLAPGRYLLRGLIDADTCLMGLPSCHGPDFNPWYGVTSEPNVHDVGGAALDANLQPRVVEVGQDANGLPLPVTGVAVSFGPQATVKLDRPVFEVVGSPRLEEGGGPLVLRLRARAIREGPVDLQTPVFRVHFSDDNRDGKADDTNGDGQPDLWPRVVVRKLARDDVGITDENDLDNNGILDAQGVSYPRMDGSQAETPDLVVLAAGLANEYKASLVDAEGQPILDKVLELSELTVGIQPVALDGRDPRAPVRLRTLPSGRYAVILMQSSGQVWRVPNELDPRLAPGLGLPQVDSQSFAVEVP
ncbi:hypothetical protein [Stigmatella aurantiaca]|uniref:Conserved uncharacterized protein n=1 Tax=Stigmatella aurantiaca (strain DW4/3-1) TaxID=378806 RepID=Q08Z45_STIAD|nr:hypothetical protein [Stigmatella aurantiaca]ADO74497.1 conserved uncharacterized protein [Stigmatella aurantiaca DW4/3-1]EAU65750.1 hypothetical protein STIAU_8139 [Stigmatella aurantiaca DW4/3-1]